MVKAITSLVLMAMVYLVKVILVPILGFINPSIGIALTIAILFRVIVAIAQMFGTKVASYVSIGR